VDEETRLVLGAMNVLVAEIRDKVDQLGTTIGGQVHVLDLAHRAFTAETNLALARLTADVARLSAQVERVAEDTHALRQDHEEHRHPLPPAAAG
jgi:hypothetical protein